MSLTQHTDDLPATSQQTQDGFVVERPKNVKRLRETWRPYAEATLGFRNHWYPICLSYELDDGKPLAQKLLGEPIILRRVDGKVYALEDRCAHRRVPLSRKFECHTQETVSCWYHGFTFDWKDGKLTTILTDPDNDLIGKLHIKTYAVEEAKGLVFVFVGDIDPPPLSDDLPPDFLDEGREVHGRRIPVKANWRWGAENGIDSSHLFIHRNSKLLEFLNVFIPMGIVAKPDHDKIMQYVTGPGPKGIIDELIDNYIPVWTSDIGQAKGVVSARMQHNHDQPTPLLPTISIWLPCGISVQQFPQPELTDFEFYVPVDEKTHLYFQTISKICTTPQEAASLREEVDTKWMRWAFEEFNGDDVGAREGLEDGYTSGDGWAQETLTRNDIAVIAWRQFASKYNRAVQKQRRVGS